MQKWLCLFGIILLPCYLLAQKNDQPYHYPIQRGSAGWSELKTYQQKRDASQIPVPVIKEMTTKALLESIWNYPLLGDIVVFNTLQEGVTKLKENFIAFNELLQREDLAVVCIDRYAKLSVDSVKQINTLYKKGEYSFQLNFLEILLAQPEVNDRLSFKDKKNLLHLLVTNFDKKENLGEVYGGHSQQITTWPVYRISLQLEKKNSLPADSKFDKGARLEQLDWKSTVSKARKLIN